MRRTILAPDAHLTRALNLDPSLAKDRGFSDINTTEVGVIWKLPSFNSQQLISFILREHGYLSNDQQSRRLHNNKGDRKNTDTKASTGSDRQSRQGTHPGQEHHD
tara:strand:- start:397 stop:711 length:315 start_codon:yes stop_codon:yes gene_type:complete